MKITLSRLNTKNLATLAQRIINLSKSGNYTIISHHPLLAALETVYNEYDAVYTKLIYSGKGNEVAEADANRDKAFSNIKSFLNGYRKLPSAANYAMAEDLYLIFKTFGLNIDRMSYSAETAQMKKLIEELEKPENVQKITTLSLNTAFDELTTKHIAFETLFAEQAEANGELRQMKSASAIRNNLEKAIKSYLNLITAMKDVPEWTKLYTDINELVKAAKNSTISSPITIEKNV